MAFSGDNEYLTAPYRDGEEFAFYSQVDYQYAVLFLQCYDRTIVNKDYLCDYIIKLDGGDYPDERIVTVKRTNLEAVQHELEWFLSGSTRTSDCKTNIWNADVKKPEWKVHNKSDDCGNIYGKMWNDFDGNNQIENAKNALKRYYDGEKQLRRRILVSAWHPLHMNSPENAFACLPPCHFAFQLVPNNDETIDMIVHMRSVDVCLGLPFNIYSYSILQEYFCYSVGKKIGNLTMHLSNCHMYPQHLAAAGPLAEKIRDALEKCSDDKKEFIWGDKIVFPLITERV